MLHSESRTIVAFAEAATPAGSMLGPPSAAIVDEVALIVRSQFGAAALPVYRHLLRAMDLAGIPLCGRRLSRLPRGERQQRIERLSQGSTPVFWLLRAVMAPIQAARVRCHDAASELATRPPLALPSIGVPERWERRLSDARELESDETIDVDCVIVGSGAGGAPMAYALAGQGHAVLILEAGGHFTRREFNGDPLLMRERMYRRMNKAMALSNAPLLIPTGATVGGSTTINSGTCYRVPERVQRRWALEEGLAELGPGSLDRYFEAVEQMIGVERARPEVLGGSARIIARGAEALGLRHEALMRNAPGCDGQGLCCFGCPTDAKRSANISYIPAAVKRGAMVYHHARVREILVDRGRAVGVVAHAQREDSSTVRLTVRASVVVLSAGSVGTPALLLSNRLANSSGQVGRRLSIHPASYAWARFDEAVRGWEGIPQGYAIEEFADLGLRFEGGFMPLDAASATFGRVGRRWTERVEGFDELAFFGFMVTDSSRGRVFMTPGGSARIAYWLNDVDRAQILRGQAILARVFLAAGARAVYPGLRGFDELHDEADVRRLEREGIHRVQARHLDLSAFHPLGSCRMGADPRRYVVGSSGESHDVRNLFVCDGSAVPGPLGVNPQVTIMALSERAAESVGRRIEEASASPSAPHSESDESGGALSFTETMAGELLICRGERAGDRVRAEFFVTATQRVAGLGGVTLTAALDGRIEIPGVVTRAPCAGTLAVRPLRRRGTLAYDLDFIDDAGEALHLRGEKSVGLLRPLRGMTTLATVIEDGEGTTVAEGVLRFDLGDLPSWLRTFRRQPGSPLPG